MIKPHIIILMILLSQAYCRGASTVENPDFAQTLSALDAAIAESPAVDAAYIRSIDEKKRNSLSSAKTPEQVYEVQKMIYGQYRFFKADSALKYADSNLLLAMRMGRDDLMWESRIHKADVLARSGLLHEAMAFMERAGAEVPDAYKEDYYATWFNICQYASEYASDTEYEGIYNGKKLQYADSLIALSNKEGILYRTVYATMMIEKLKRPEEARDYLLGIIGDYAPGTREYAVVASIVAYASQMAGDHETHQYWLAKSALSDIQGSVKENMAIRMLADIRLGNSDVERARSYMTKSFEDAAYYCARMRNIQSAAVFPLVSAAYDKMQRNRRVATVIIIVLLLLVAVVTVTSYVIIRKKNKKLALRNKVLKEGQENMARMNDELQHAYSCLESTNRSLSESKLLLEEANKVKQAYLSKFIWLCSSTINKMVSYRNRLYLLAKSDKRKALVDALSSQKETNDLSADFYEAFDTAFLTIHPDFIRRFNSLLVPSVGEQEKDDLPTSVLTTEQRIAALINLGISDSRSMADFLHCTLSTIYTYRSRLKGKALRPDSFEEELTRL